MDPPALPNRTVTFISIATAFSLLGDQALYAVLPVLYENLGLVAIEVGILLSVNRWIRLLSNELAHRATHHLNPSLLLISALILGALTTASYAYTQSFTILLTARMLWGLSWSFIRHIGVSTIMASEPLEQAGRTMGWYNGISRAGSVAGLFGGALLIDLLGFHTGILILAGISLSAVALTPRNRINHTPSQPAVRPRAPITLLTLGVILGAVGPGFVMSTLGAAVANRMLDTSLLISATVLTGALLGARYVMDSMAAPWLGGSFDRFGFSIATQVYLLIGGIALLTAAGMNELLLFSAATIVFFICSTALQAGVAATASKLGSGAYARYVTASDLGSASGPLLGWFIVDRWQDPSISIAVGGIMFLCAAFIAYSPSQKSIDGAD